MLELEINQIYALHHAKGYHRDLAEVLGAQLGGHTSA
ncbi:hypothetical protein EST38_g13562 [Candolleomyces aberdarensis]|uniref:Uncharacterized protein n=1 Tax=Candolleomyces aberdarensis TaxID=2316362 RepID=A0A4Q2D0P3_9AGAR|nr:hypothetical protein EST38_g13562 [Candolleomyces aberdarensis]